MLDYLIVGAGLAGCVLAERIASVQQKRVLLVDVRDHLGGCCQDYRDEHGILVHRYGPHWFHTSNEKVFEYLSHFTGWRPHVHVVQAEVEGKLVPLPINLDTLNLLYGMQLQSREEMTAFLDSVREPIVHPRNAEEQVLSLVGRDLYEKLFLGYTRKQWDREPSALLPSVTARIAVRFDHDYRYFVDRYQGLPDRSYSQMFARMVDHPNISVLLGIDYRSIVGCVRFDRMIYTGPIDSFFDCCYGPLPYRSLRFENETYAVERYQQRQQVNYPGPVPFTRRIEWKHATGQRHPMTTVTREFPAEPTGDHDKYYPVPTEDSERLHTRYRRVADGLSSVTFVGRLADYRYYNMDQVVARALDVFENEITAR